MSYCFTCPRCYGRHETQDASFAPVCCGAPCAPEMYDHGQVVRIAALLTRAAILEPRAFLKAVADSYFLIPERSSIRINFGPHFGPLSEVPFVDEVLPVRPVSYTAWIKRDEDERGTGA